MNCVFIFKSITHAQSAVQKLAKAGVSGSIFKPPVSLGKGSCSHGVKIRDKDLARARQALAGGSPAYTGIYMMLPQGKYQEVVQ